MRHADRATSLTDADLSPQVKALITGTVYNQQIREYQEPGKGNPTVASLRYANKDRTRPKRRHYSYFESDYDYLDIPTFLELLGFDDEEKTLRFQLESWRSVRKAHEAVKETNNDQGLVLSAPTGFGKTAGFSGEILRTIADTSEAANAAIFVYPSRALLRDQLSTALERSTNLAEMDGFEQPSIGVWSGDIPFNRWQVLDGSNDITANQSGPRGSDQALSIIRHWDDDRGDSNLYVGEAETDEHLPYWAESDESDYEVYTANEDVVFTSEDLILHRNGFRYVTDELDRPRLLFTTLESLENIGMKPHYSIVATSDFFVFDEIHQYTGIRGAHAANIVENIRWVRDQHDESDHNAVYIGASATVAEPAEFTRDLFGFESTEAVDYIRPFPEDIDDNNEDKQHFYFLLTPDGENAPGVASQYIQQALLTGHSFLSKKEEEARSKLLTFIDSTSQVNRLTQQIIDAKSKNLYQKHIDIENGDWREMADMANRDFGDFKDPVAIHADSDTSLSEVADADLVNSTSFLEIGVDIGDLEYIGQYRPPQDLTTFMQRAGRGGRSKGDDSHIQVFLSSYAGDENFFYRADRFLNGDIHTPLNTDNSVVNWIHNQFRAAFKAVDTIQEEYGSNWSNTAHESATVQRLFVDELGYERFHYFLTDPDSALRELVEASGPAGMLYKKRERVEEVRDILNEQKSEVKNELREKSKLLAPTDDPDKDIPDATSEKLRELADQALANITTASEIIEAESLGEKIDKEQLSDTRGQLELFEEQEFNEQVEILNQAVDTLGQIWFQLRSDIRDTKYEDQMYDNDDVRELEEAADFLASGNLEPLIDERDKINHLLRSLEGIDSYLDVRELGTAHGSLSAYKGLLQSAYFFNRAWQIEENEYEHSVRIGEAYRDDPEAEFWYVPDDYFENAGRYFTLIEARENDAGEQVIGEASVDNLFKKYVPYKTEYLDEGELQAFRPEITTNAEGATELKLSEESTFEHKGVEIPEQIELTEIRDYSGEEADGIYALNPANYQLLSPDEVDDLGVDPLFAKLFARADIRTNVEHKTDTPEFQIGNLWAGPVDGEALLEAVTLEITAYERQAADFVPNKDREIPDQRFVSDTDFGFVLETTGITWDLSSFLTDLFETEVGQAALEEAKKHKEFAAVNEETSALVTAAHFLTLLVADVTGAGTQLLLYGIDKENQRVHVFDQTQGGQGIIELFYEEMERNPTAVIDSVYRLVHNSQILNDDMWGHENSPSGYNRLPWEIIRDEVSIDALQDRDSTVTREECLEEIADIVQNVQNIDFEPSLERIAEETASTIERIHYLSDEADVDAERIYELKHILSKKRREGASSDQIPQPVLSEFEDVFSDEALDRETIRNLLYPPDMDSCKANLQLESTIVDADQSEALSYALLAHLTGHVIGTLPVEERDQLHEQGRFWGRVTDSNVEYLSWSDDV
ncbi:DEAD/DEAH box helicase [Haloarcula sediminis]|uniref:DEAD/DEAH box helicase n=1 Tax=Haloarcula sediminis TaxID=3111777 RepID=UPI002D778115|nr:DEAD/DEAH box helicase [Haloarcula sp. CK38]